MGKLKSEKPAPTKEDQSNASQQTQDNEEEVLLIVGLLDYWNTPIVQS